MVLFLLMISQAQLRRYRRWYICRKGAFKESPTLLLTQILLLPLEKFSIFSQRHTHN